MTPIERAAEAMHALGNSDPWERQHEYVRQEFRDDARAAFESIDVDEMARALQQRAGYEGVAILDHRAQRIARDLRTYLLTGDESDE